MPMSLITRLLEDEDEMSDAERREFHELEGSNEEAGRERLERDNERFNEPSPLEASRLRQDRLIQGLKDLGAEYGVEFAATRIDSRGEFTLSVDAPGFGAELADLLNAHRPRCGAQAMDPGHLLPTSTWCHMNHFDVEKMLRDVHITESARKCAKCHGKLPVDSGPSVHVCPAGHGCSKGESLVDSLLDEGGATPGYDIPMVLKVVLPGLKDKGIWYVEVKPPGKESGAWERLKAWAINRVAAAMLRSSGEEISGRGIVQLLRDHPPTVKDVSNEDDGNWAARSRFIPIKKKQPAGY